MFNCGCRSHTSSPANKLTHAAGTLAQEANFVTVPARIPKFRIKRGVLLLSNTLPELWLRSNPEQLRSNLLVVHIWRETGAQHWCSGGLRACSPENMIFLCLRQVATGSKQYREFPYDA